MSNINIIYCQNYLRLVRADAKERGIKLPKRIRAFRMSSGSNWFYVSMDGGRTEEIVDAPN